MRTKIKTILKFIGQFLTVLAMISLFTHFSVFAKEYLPISNPTKEIYAEGQIPTPAEGDDGQAILKKAILGGLQYVKIITVVIGILYLTIMAYTLVTQGHSEEDVTKAKRGMIYTLIAFMMISMSQNVAKIFDMENGTLLQNPQEILKRVHLFDKQVEIFVTFVKYTLGAYAALQVVRSGISLVTRGGNEEEATKDKKSLLYSAGGLVLIYVGDVFINKVFYKVDKTVYSGITGVHPKVDAKAGVDQIVGITNFIVSFVGPIAVLMLIAGAIMYATAGGQDENMQKAKRIILTAAIGLAIIFGAFAIVSTVLSGHLENIGTLME